MRGGNPEEMMGSVRWAFRCGSWTPTRLEWLFAARCIQPEEKERIGQFLFTKDAKSAMAGRLLLRRFVCEKMSLPWSHFRLDRSPKGKPYLAIPVQDGPASLTWSFNLSHQGDYAVLAAEQGRQVGVDIMKTVMPGSSSVPEFFRIMTRQFTPYEWSVIQSAGSEHQQLAVFYRHWALKESFIKAIGTGLGFNLQRAEFHLPPEPLTQGQPVRRTTMHLDEEEQDDWVFELGSSTKRTCMKDCVSWKPGNNALISRRDWSLGTGSLCLALSPDKRKTKNENGQKDHSKLGLDTLKLKVTSDH